MPALSTDRVAVIGAGIGGLVAAIDLAARGVAVTVLERAATTGGKMRVAEIGGHRIDAGPTVFTMRYVFDALFAAAGTTLEAEITLQPAEILARHGWRDGSTLDLFADPARSADAIGRFAGAEAARGYVAFCTRAARVFATLQPSFIDASRPSLPELIRRAGPRALAGISPFSTLWQALGSHFADPRLRQLFGRYATYCGASPFAAPATLMLVAHVEQDGVWLIEGGMQRLADALVRVATRLGVTIRTDTEVARIATGGGRASGVVLAGGETISADAVVCNADAAALRDGLFGSAPAGGSAASARSLSAVTWATTARSEGFDLLRHTVLFSDDYRAEFDAIFAHRRLPEQPTVYVCAQDRGANETSSAPPGEERLLVLVNAPASGDDGTPDTKDIEACRHRTIAHLQRCGLRLCLDPSTTVTTGPREFATLFPATGGALYGPASHGWAASFRRPGSRSNCLPGLYLAGGSVHPGPGVPMAAISGRLAASALMADRASIARSRRTAMSGGMSTR